MLCPHDIVPNKRSIELVHFPLSMADRGSHRGSEKRQLQRLTHSSIEQNGESQRVKADAALAEVALGSSFQQLEKLIWTKAIQGTAAAVQFIAYLLRTST